MAEPSFVVLRTTFPKVHLCEHFSGCSGKQFGILQTQRLYQDYEQTHVTDFSPVLALGWEVFVEVQRQMLALEVYL